MAQTSIVDYLTANGKDSSLGARADLAVSNGLVSSRQDYLNLAASGQNGAVNTALLTKLQSTPAATTPPAATPPTTPVASPYITTAGKTSGATSNVSSGPITTSQLGTGVTSPEPTSLVTPPANTMSFNDRVTQVAGSTLTANQQAIDNLRSQLQTQKSAEVAAVDTQLSAERSQLQNIVGTTQVADALKAVNDKFQVEQNIQLYSTIQQRIVDAQEALNMGLIYEADRPARMKFVTGAESTLQKQGLATIGALQGTAAVIKGNIDLAKAYADSTISAINADNEQSFKALTTLIDLDNSKLVSLKAEEKQIINDRLSSIETQAQTLQKNKDDVVDLMTKYPKAFLNGGVTLLDTKEQAIAKMLPTMAEDEKLKFNAELAAKNRSNATSGTKAATAAQVQAAKTQLLDYKAKGMTYDEAVTAFGDVLDVKDIAAYYGRPVNSDGTAGKTDLYSNFINPDGTPKSGYSVSLDSKGQPIIQKAADTAEPGFWGNIGQAFSSLFK